MQPTQVNHLTHTTDVAASTTSRVNVARSRSALGPPFVPSGGKCLKSVVMLRAIRLADHHPEPASRAHAAANDTSKFSRNDTRRWWTGYVGNEQAGHNLAVLQTLVMSCHQHGVDPVEYLSD